MLLKKLIFASGARVLSLVLLLLVCLLTPSTCSAYRDPVLVPGTVYHANDVRHVHNLVRKYMRYSTAATSFVDFDDGWTSCGIACNSPDVRTVMLNVTWHIDFPLSDGFVALHHNDREIVVSWAGTHRYRALLMDMVFFTSPYIEGEDMNVHSGFLESVRGIIGPVKQHLEALMDEFPDYTVVVTGHSKGGGKQS
ncbi:hypothetical protein FBU59_004431 [Linderina macrospora]|uniref:Uncharacterized protein n=1 Tax=Linderina macrospora TaxID=4868 RepID=A0ACC1J5T8_9FUNG|nr:hypothetical protein FBU59_004431 [Linderina macrospora]